ncbi:Abi family protein [Leyella stercorea]
MAKRNFGKEYKTSQELVTILEHRGLTINDRQKAQLYLESIGYYRLSAYMHPLLKTPKSLHQYKTGASFAKVMMLYRFDKKLRMVLFNEIEKIEIAIREAVMNMAAERTGDIYWLTNSSYFRDQTIFNNSMAMLSKEYERSTEDFIEHFKRTYTEPFPPAWILGELLPMGSVNMYYRNLKDKTLKKQIAKRFSLHAPVLESWLSVLTLTRNACCHHARVWNKVNKIIPNDMKGMTMPWITIDADKRRIYYNICIIKYFLNIISPNNDMSDKINRLFEAFPEIDQKALGFTVGWENEPLWHH